MAKVRVTKNNLDSNLNGNNFENTASQTIFKFGSFALTSNFEGRKVIDYSQQLSTFVRPVTLETLEFSNEKSEQILNKTNNVVLNLDRSDINSFAKFGSAYEFLRVSVENIISSYPGSLFINSQLQRNGNTTVFDFSYNRTKNISTFKIPSPYTVNKFGLVYDIGNEHKPDDVALKNLNLTYSNYIIWSKDKSSNYSFTLVGFTGDTIGKPYLDVKCIGKPFNFTGDSGQVDYHIRPNTSKFDDYRESIKDYERNMLSSRVGVSGFEFKLKNPTLLDDGNITYNDKTILWATSDGYNVDIDTPSYKTFLESLLGIGNKYDQIKTDLIARFLSPTSLKTYDLTEDKKVSKMLRIYGAEFDLLKQFIDSLVYINKVTYDKKNNLPDQIVSNLARTFGWEYFQLVKEKELVESVFSMDETERDLNTDLTPAEVDVEMWRRILINTNYFWKSKGTREAVKSMFALIGIPEPFISITEYVYTVDGIIDPRSVELTLDDLPSASLPYDSNGYPIAPVESDSFYFQMSGDTDSGQAYMNNFRNVGFDLMLQVDNKKSWTDEAGIYRRHYSSPTYYEQDDRLILNTKEIDISLDTSRGVEYDVYKYVKEIDFPANSTGYTLPFAFVNLSLNVPVNTTTGTQQFSLPDLPEGDMEVRFNGVLLNGPKYTYDDNGELVTVVGLPPAYGNPADPNFTSGHTDYFFVDDYGQPSVSATKKFVIGESARNDGQGNRDVVEATYLYRQGSGLAQITVRYVVTRIAPSMLDAAIPLPETPNGDVQLTINGVAAVKGTAQFIADYVVNGDTLIIQNPDLLSYFNTNPYVQVAYITVSGSSAINARQEINRVDSLCSGKVYFNNSANRAVYRLNYKINNENAVKVLVDGIALEPNTDYYVNPNNPYEIFLPPNVNLGSVISAYYVLGDSAAFDPIVGGNFGLGDISNLSFLEFIELVQKRLVNATNRKVVTDHKGGWYPTLLRVYNTYLSRANLDAQDPLKSNGYTFQNLYPFLNKYNAFFQKFIDKLLSATVIQRKGGLLVRNTVFTKQKFTYKRGVYMGVTFDKPVPGRAPKFQQDSFLSYYGDDGATYIKKPLYQYAEWTDDFIVIPDYCDLFVVENVKINYPVATTTTTQMPFNSVVYMYNTYTQYNPDPGYGADSTEKYSLTFNPGIIPSYSVDMNLNFVAEFTNTGNTDTVIIANMEVRINNVIEYAYTGQIQTSSVPYPTGDEIFNKDFEFTVNEGDTVDVTLYVNVSKLSYSDDLVECKLRVTPESKGVTPNGAINAFVPLEVSNLASDGY